MKKQRKTKTGASVADQPATKFPQTQVAGRRNPGSPNGRTPERQAEIDKIKREWDESQAAKAAKAPKPPKSPRVKKPAKASKKTSATGGGKGAKMIELISRSAGATIDEIMTETGWQAHSVRGFISTLGKKGNSIASAKNEYGVRFYKLTS